MKVRNWLIRIVKFVDEKWKIGIQRIVSRQRVVRHERKRRGKQSKVSLRWLVRFVERIVIELHRMGSVAALNLEKEIVFTRRPFHLRRGEQFIGLQSRTRDLAFQPVRRLNA